MKQYHEQKNPKKHSMGWYVTDSREIDKVQYIIRHNPPLDMVSEISWFPDSIKEQGKWCQIATDIMNYRPSLSPPWLDSLKEIISFIMTSLILVIRVP